MIIRKSVLSTELPFSKDKKINSDEQTNFIIIPLCSTNQKNINKIVKI